MKIISGTHTSIISAKIASLINVELVNIKINIFDDHELQVEIIDDITNEDIVIIKSLSKPVNDNFMELLLIIDATKRAFAKSIIVIIPYFAYARGDRRFSKNYSSIASHIVANILESMNVTRIISIDLHSKQIESLFQVPIVNIDFVNIFLKDLELNDDIILICPDYGAFLRYFNYMDDLKFQVNILNKIRNANNQIINLQFFGNVENKICLIIDDIIATGQTICKISNLLIQNGAREVNVFATHALLTIDSMQKIEESYINKIYITDTIENIDLSSKFNVISTANILAETILKLI
jgi:ribose-phosphate pyrophosphokinase